MSMDVPIQDQDDGDQPTLNQIRVYLIKQGTTLPDGALRTEGDAETFPVDAHGLRGHLVVARPPTRRPDWLPFIEDVLGAEVPYPGNSHISAVLLLERGEKAYALTFGFGRHLLDPEALEPDFGLRTAAGLIDPDAIAGVDSRAFEATVLQVRRQSSHGTGTRAIGLDVGREMLRAIAGEMLATKACRRSTGRSYRDSHACRRGTLPRSLGYRLATADECRRERCGRTRCGGRRCERSRISRR